MNSQINTAFSNEYFKSFNNDQYKIISFYAERARELMARFMIENQISDPEQLKGFDYDGYYLDPSESTEDKLAFKRDLKPQS
ncbi:MAG: peroxide stress protein YaaA [Cyclobacteriaceae bacterium]